MNEIDLSALSPDQQLRWRHRLDKLPPGIRDTLRKNLQRVPADKVARILSENEGTLSRLEGKLGAVADKATAANGQAPRKVHQFSDKSHYSNTVQPGDDQGLPWITLFVVAAALALGAGWLLENVAR